MRTAIKRTGGWLSVVTLAGAIGIGAAACGRDTSISQGPQPSQSEQYVPPTYPELPTEPAEPTEPAPAPAQSGPVGTTFTVDTTNMASEPVSYEITLSKVADPAEEYDPEYSMVKAGYRAVAVEVTSKCLSGAVDQAPDMYLTVTGSDGSVHQTSMIMLADKYPSTGTATLMPGEHDTGWVSFEIPDGVTVKSVRYTPNMYEGSNSATWLVGTQS